MPVNAIKKKTNNLCPSVFSWYIGLFCFSGISFAPNWAMAQAVASSNDSTSAVKAVKAGTERAMSHPANVKDTLASNSPVQQEGREEAARLLPRRLYQEFASPGGKKNSRKWKRKTSLQRTRWPLGEPDSPSPDEWIRTPHLSPQQVLKGQVAGLYVQETSSEPGTMQSMLLRGTSVPLFSNKSIWDAQPAVYINGIPVIENRSFPYNIKSNETTPLGTASNLLATLDMDNVTSIEVVKNPVKLAELGPLASNGAIYIMTKDGFYGGKHVTIDASLTTAIPRGGIKMTNAIDERNFRAGFYPSDWDEGTLNNYLPTYLTDRSNAYFFGKSDWADSYYSVPVSFDINASIGNNQARANYLFTIGATTDAGVADKTKYNKYNVSFYLNMLPAKGLTFSTMLQAAMASRTPSNTLRNRYAEIEYYPSLDTPIGPSKESYETYLSYHSDTQDNNDNASLHGLLSLEYALGRVRASAGLKFDYGADVRHVFWPTMLMEGVNFVSDYSGYNRRIIGYANIGYDWLMADKHLFSLTWSGNVQEDRYHYSYSRGYDGGDDTKPTTSGGNYRMYRFLDQETLHLVSSAFTLDYDFNHLFSAKLLFRQDGASSVQPDSRWLMTPAVGAEWNMKRTFLRDASWIDRLALWASWARIGKLTSTDVYGIGPQYRSDNISWGNGFIYGSFNGFATITRPYRQGWVGYGIGWPYADKIEAALEGAFLKNRVRWNVTYYYNKDKDLMVKIPMVHESGYSGRYAQGMEIANTGVEATLSVTPIELKDFRWNWDFNIAYNKNKLTALPEGLSELEVDGRMLKVGESVDRFYLLENEGIFTDVSQIPQKDGKLLSVNGVEFGVGDPIWKDRNGDNMITDEDKITKEHSLPDFTGGIASQLSYKRWDLSFSFYFALGQSAMNYRAYQQYDFTTLDNSNDLAAVKEVFFWQNGNVPMDYLRYSALSEVHPYRVDQDLYLENTSYLKLRSVSLGYKIPLKQAQGRRKKDTGKTFSVNDLYLYVTASNLFTVSGFSGDDPEAVDFDGYYRGYGLGMPRSFTLGVRFKF